MRGWIIIFILTLLLVSTGLAEDLEVTINEAESDSSVGVAPNQEIEINIEIAKGVLIQNINVDSDNVFVKQIAQKHLFEKQERQEEDSLKIEKINLPGFLPSGGYPFNLEFIYDKDGKQYTKTEEFTMDIESAGFSSTAAGFIATNLPESVGREILNKISPIELEDIPEGLTAEEKKTIRNYFS